MGRCLNQIRYFLALDPRAGTVTRYVSIRGHNDIQRLERAVMDPPELVLQWGSEGNRAALEKFRLYGMVA